MLDLAHPQTEHIFRASQTEDRIRLHLLRWREGSDTGSRPICSPDVLSVLLPTLHKFNSEHFGNSAGITDILRRLELAVREADSATAWNAFLALTEGPGENFGTWAI